MSTVDNLPEVAAGTRTAGTPGVAAGTRRMEPLNLARRPFLNSRPVVRAALVLWLLGILLLLGNVSLFWGYLTRSADKRQQIAHGEEEIDKQQQTTHQFESRLDSIDLASLNLQVDFLNQRIAERTFSWSLLLDRLGAVLPRDVRLTRLAPQTGDQAARRRLARASGRGDTPPGEQVYLTILAEARGDHSDEVLNQLVEQMFAHPAFRHPDVTREEHNEGNIVKFELNVIYIPGEMPAGVESEGAPAIEEVPVPGGAVGTAAPPSAPAVTPSAAGGQP